MKNSPQVSLYVILPEVILGGLKKNEMRDTENKNIVKCKTQKIRKNRPKEN